MFCAHVSGELTLSVYGNGGLLTIHGESAFRMPLHKMHLLTILIRLSEILCWPS